RTVGKNTGPDNPTSKRRNSPAQRRALKEFKKRVPKPTPTSHAGHRIDLQYDGSGRVGGHWRDYVWEEGTTNVKDGSRGYKLLKSHPQGVLAGGVARPSTAGTFRNSRQFRTGMRFAGGALTAVGGGLSVYGLYQDVVEGDLPMGVGDSLGVIGGGL